MYFDSCSCRIHPLTFHFTTPLQSSLGMSFLFDNFLGQSWRCHGAITCSSRNTSTFATRLLKFACLKLKTTWHDIFIHFWYGEWSQFFPGTDILSQKKLLLLHFCHVHQKRTTHRFSVKTTPVGSSHITTSSLEASKGHFTPSHFIGGFAQIRKGWARTRETVPWWLGSQTKHIKTPGKKTHSSNRICWFMALDHHEVWISRFYVSCKIYSTCFDILYPAPVWNRQHLKKLFKSRSHACDPWIVVHKTLLTQISFFLPFEPTLRILQYAWIEDNFISPTSISPLNKDEIVGQMPYQTTKLCGDIVMSPKFIGECWSLVTDHLPVATVPHFSSANWLLSEIQNGKNVIMFDHVGGYSILSSERVQTVVLACLVTNSFLWRPSGKLAIAQPSDCSTCQRSKLVFCHK